MVGNVNLPNLDSIVRSPWHADWARVGFASGKVEGGEQARGRS